MADATASGHPFLCAETSAAQQLDELLRELGNVGEAFRLSAKVLAKSAVDASIYPLVHGLVGAPWWQTVAGFEGAVGAGGRRDHWNSAGAVGDPAAPAARLRRAAVGDASGTGANVACQLEGFLVFPFGHPHALFYISLDSIFECFPIPFEFF